jgi:hypothetical protein
MNHVIQVVLEDAGVDGEPKRKKKVKQNKSRPIAAQGAVLRIQSLDRRGDLRFHAEPFCAKTKPDSATFGSNAILPASRRLLNKMEECLKKQPACRRGVPPAGRLALL